MFLQTALSTLLVTFMIAEGFVHEELRKRLCDTEVDFRDDFVKCLKTMNPEIQIVITMCGCVLHNETSCEYTKIIEDMCADAEHSQNISQCIKLFMAHNHSLEIDEEHGHHHHHHHHHNGSDKHDHSQRDHDDHHHHHHDDHDHSQHDHKSHDVEKHNEEKDDDEDELTPEKGHKDCLKELFSKYDISWKEPENAEEEQ
ncbi:hypothetical protein JTE90_012008 [Oedothorax gibbosus]|uniref:Uncharacterized protein n=1 Tax=Oedothorax gibbosus TaxID=931172 RepID=A0AAV6UPV0_9ARAC|nr:hypothetical protein JTE90_012008 [Oedothorax gibbosus]